MKYIIYNSDNNLEIVRHVIDMPRGVAKWQDQAPTMTGRMDGANAVNVALNWQPRQAWSGQHGELFVRGLFKECRTTTFGNLLMIWIIKLLQNWQSNGTFNPLGVFHISDSFNTHLVLLAIFTNTMKGVYQNTRCNHIYYVSEFMYQSLCIRVYESAGFMYQQALTLAMCPLSRMPFWGCRASSGHHNLFSTGPGAIFFLVLRMWPLFFTGNRQNSEGNVNSYLFFVIYRPNVQKFATSRVKS